MTIDNNKVRFDQDLIERYGGRGPRYTSYPTALQFDESITAADYERIARDSNSVLQLTLLLLRL
jgi:oxygen-independent coproporphyrinogen-3 oxidase